MGESFGARLAGSLSLLADSVHALSDALAAIPNIIVALYAAHSTGTARRARYRVALINSATLFGVAGYILLEAWDRYLSPHDINADTMIGVATLALIGNGLALWILGSHSEHDHESQKTTHMGMSYHVVSDFAQSGVVLITAVVIKFTEFTIIDLLLSIGIAILIFWLSVVLAWRAVTR